MVIDYFAVLIDKRSAVEAGHRARDSHSLIEGKHSVDRSSAYKSEVHTLFGDSLVNPFDVLFAQAFVVANQCAVYVTADDLDVSHYYLLFDVKALFQLNPDVVVKHYQAQNRYC